MTDSTPLNTLEIPRPDDWHLHLRDDVMLIDVLPYTSRSFARAIVMPNLKPPITTTEMAMAYRDRILAAIPSGHQFEPLMTLYLTDNTSAEEIDRAVNCDRIFGVKLYPAGATTNADAGVTDLSQCWPALARMAECGLPLLVHGEVTDASVDIFDREAVFINTVLQPLTEALPELKVVFEHITTAEAAAFVASAPAQVAATVTPQHLLHDRNALFSGGLRPHAWCLPVLKRERHRAAVLAAVTGESSHKFFLGTDSAPHLRNAKESDCGCAGIFNAPQALEHYAAAFDSVGRLDKLRAFASENGPAFYGLPVNQETVRLERLIQTVPAEIASAAGTIVPMSAGLELGWQLLTA